VTVNECWDLFTVDPDFIPLMVWDNYPAGIHDHSTAFNVNSPSIELLAECADLISNWDIRLIEYHSSDVQDEYMLKQLSVFSCYGPGHYIQRAPQRIDFPEKINLLDEKLAQQ